MARIPALQNKSSSFFPGNNPPKYITGNSYLPSPYRITPAAGTITTTATRLYYFPLAIWDTKSFAGAQAFNSGAADNGETARIGVYNDDGATGGPGSLAKDFGEITLTAASALRTLASTWTATPGMYWGCFHASSAAAWYGMSIVNQVSNAGYIPALVSMESLIGYITPAPASGNVQVSGLYVDTAYGALASTAVAPTGVLADAGSATLLPAVWLKA